jgi:urocanate hydratase
MRHADAGYAEALDAARTHALDLPSLREPSPPPAA